MAKISYAIAIGKDEIDTGHIFRATRKRGLYPEARRLIKDGKAVRVEIHTVDRCGCGCGGAHADKPIAFDTVSRDD